MSNAHEIRSAADRALGHIISAVPGFNPPEQKRSREKTLNVLTALAVMLQQRPFNKISIQDIANEARCAVTVIYARFKDKESMLSAIHLILLERQRFYLTETIENMSGRTFYDLVEIVVMMSEQFHTENMFFVQAAVGCGNPSVYLITENILEPYSVRLMNALERFADGGQSVNQSSITCALRILFSIHRDATMAFPNQKMPSQELLVKIFVSIVDEKLEYT